MTGPVLVVNSGSSSLKYAVVDPDSGGRRVEGLVERIGEPGSDVPDHVSAFGRVRAGLTAADLQPSLVGHRVVHGGALFTDAAVIDDRVIVAITDCVPLAPLHNPAALAGIRAAELAYPDAVGVAVFDTAFHATMPAAARTYALDRDLAAAHGLRRYGFHGTSHQFVARRTAELLGRPPASVNLITLHLGNGASACAVAGGRSVDTSMGVTPLEGLVMGTRSGDVDPAIPLILSRAGMSAAEIDAALNRNAGLVGLAGVNDMRSVHQRADAGDRDADLAREVFAHRVRHYLGAYVAVLGSVDAVAFTAGIGEHDAWTRARVCADLLGLGIDLDREANERPGAADRRISTAQSGISVWVVHTDEELAIARESVRAVAAAG
ncbi:MAG: acetate kinase [Candidatus Nanopelagicales bacterium]